MDELFFEYLYGSFLGGNNEGAETCRYQQTTSRLISYYLFDISENPCGYPFITNKSLGPLTYITED